MDPVLPTPLHWKSGLFNWLVWLIGTRTHRQSRQALLLELRDGKEKWIHQAPPDSLLSKKDLTVTKEVVGADRPGSSWDIWHLNPRRGSASKQVIVFFHGGGLYLGIHSLSWVMAYKDFIHLGQNDCVIPLYTLAPYSTASSFTSTSLQFILELTDDPRYANKEIVLYGESAGGWAAWRTLLALTEVAAGKETLGVSEEQVDGWGIDLVRRARQRISKIVTVGAMVEATLDDPSDLAAAKNDPFLSLPALRTAAKTWSYGPYNAFPEFDFNLPSTAVSLAEPSSVLDIPLSASCFSPGKGTAILQEYMQTCPAEYKPSVLQIFGTVGTYDCLYPTNKRLFEALGRLGPEVAETEFYIYPGMTHLFTATSWTHEGEDAKRKIATALSR